ncbi:MAG: threonine ammonia-lyase [Bellilinea sp.]
MIPIEWLAEAKDTLLEKVRVTPVTFDSDLNAYLKWENRQITGSFKIRGAINKIANLQPWERSLGLVTASAGNHGQGVAYAAREFGIHSVIFASDHAVPAKVDAMRGLGAEVRLVSGGYAAAEKAGLGFAVEAGRTWISPYNDGRVIAGQAAVGLELVEQIQPFDAKSVVIPVGGGGLLAGTALAIQSRGIRTRIIGVQSEASSFMHAIFNGKQQESVVEWDSLADGLAGKIEDSSITIPAVRELADDIVLVSEASIENAIVYAWEKHHEIIEGSAAVALAALLTGKVPDLPAVLVITGGNIQPEVHQDILSRSALNRQTGGLR